MEFFIVGLVCFAGGIAVTVVAAKQGWINL